MSVEFSSLFLPAAINALHSSSGFFISPGGNKTQRFFFFFGFIPPFIYSVSPSDFHSRARDTHTRSLHRHTHICMYSKAQPLSSRWDTVLREETGAASDCSLPWNTSYSKQIKMDSKATGLHSTAQKGVEVVSANQPMITEESKCCWLPASVISVHTTVWTFSVWSAQLRALLSERSREGLTSTFPQISSRFKL